VHAFGSAKAESLQLSSRPIPSFLQETKMCQNYDAIRQTDQSILRTVASRLAVRFCTVLDGLSLGVPSPKSAHGNDKLS
jgi:hypothetical protein